MTALGGGNGKRVNARARSAIRFDGKRQEKMKRLEVEVGELGNGDGGWMKKKRTRGDGGAKERKKRGIRQAETSCKKGWQGEAPEGYRSSGYDIARGQRSRHLEGQATRRNTGELTCLSLGCNSDAGVPVWKSESDIIFIFIFIFI